MMTHARLGPVIPVLDVKHVEDSLAFYVDRLGFQVDFRYQNEPGSYAGVRRDDVRLHLRRDHDGHAGNGNGKIKCRIAVDDPDALHAEFRSMGVLDGEVEVHETEYGTREFGFEDPDGNNLVFFRIL
jgi:catechol 2,3-dioxygenase-like lactoylglutathione lyase family enzyme